MMGHTLTTHHAITPPALALPPLAAATAPPEHRGLARDELRLLTTRGAHAPATHSRVRDLADELRAGDVLVVNRSATVPASLPAGDGLRVHLSTQLSPDTWIVELRRERAHASLPWFGALPGLELALPGGAYVTLVAPHPSTPVDAPRLWLATTHGLTPDYVAARGRPIQYDYTSAPWPIEAYATVFGEEPGSAEMPSASRGFSESLVEELKAKGVGIAPITLHCGVASLDAHEPPHEEYARVERETIERIERARATGGRVVAVGTTVMRALAAARDATGALAPFEGLTDVLLGPGDDTSHVDGLISGFHPPEASHVHLLATLVSPAHLLHAYAEAASRSYLSHEFGDVHLMWRDVLPVR